MRKFIFFSLLFLPAMIQSQVQFTQSNLPIISINTLGKEILDDPKIMAEMKIFAKGQGQINFLTDEPLGYDGKIGIELRGSSSQSFPKKPYGFETWDDDGEDNDVSLIGMPEESDWTLNATYNDKTLMRDGLAYMLAGEIMPYAPRVRYVELLVNQQYQGVYKLIEKIKRDKNRVDIKKMETTDNEGDKLTGGYILKWDKETGSNSGEGWISTYPPFPGAWQSTFFQYEYPKADEITPQQKTYIQNHLRQVENTMHSANYTDPVFGYRKFIDINSVIDFIIINELTKNPDAYRLSTFFYKKRESEGGKLFFGPVWDFNLGFGNVDYCTNGNPEGLVIENFNQICPDDNWVIHFWWQKFMNDPQFVQSLKSRWKFLRETRLSNAAIHHKIDSIKTLLTTAQTRNFQRWPVLGTYVWPNYYVGQSYNDEVNYLKNWLNMRLVFLDGKWGSPTATEDRPTKNSAVYPNPATNHLTIRSENIVTSVFLVNQTGSSFPCNFTADDGKYNISLEGVSAGFYMLRVWDRSSVQTFPVLVY
jgi:hypothetical protein